MGKILYVGQIIDKPKTGGEICCYNNQIVLKSIFGDGFYKYELSTESSFQVLLNKFFLLYPGLQVNKFEKMYRYIDNISPDYIFIETAQYGILAKKIKKRFPQIKIITFFHNIEIQYAKSYLSFKNPKSWYFYILTKYNESKAMRFSDYRFTINKADSDLMFETYRIKASFVMPFAVENRISSEIFDELQKDNNSINRKNSLFVGSNFFGNTEGLNWYIENVLPKVDVHLTIVGNGMSKAFSNSDKITVYDFVDDLSAFYKKADFVVLPIISGGGMKTKTAEAMMWGKVILATKNAFTGYDIDNCKGLYVCESADDYIETIRKIYDEDFNYFNKSIHERFIEKHSIDSTISKMRLFFEGECKC